MNNYSKFIGIQVRCYRNLRNGKISLQQKVNGNWKVIAHADKVVINQAVFKVYETGRQRVIKEKRKRVHAYVEGILAPIPRFFQLDSDKVVTYNPYKYSSFVMKDSEEPVVKTSCALIESNGTILIE